MIYLILLGYTIITLGLFILFMKYSSTPITEEEEQYLEEHDKKMRNGKKTLQ